jgi:hypothetical protein
MSLHICEHTALELYDYLIACRKTIGHCAQEEEKFEVAK